jgi:hypothetical protein
MTRPGTTAERDALNRRYQELENQLPTAFPAQRDEIIQEMEDIERRLRQLSSNDSGRKHRSRGSSSAPPQPRPVAGNQRPNSGGGSGNGHE